MSARVLAVTLALVSGCTRWDEVKQGYCSTHAGQGNCSGAVGGGSAGSGGSGGGSAGGAGGGSAGGVAFEFDGGPPVDWAVRLGGTKEDDALALVMDARGGELALTGRFTSTLAVPRGATWNAGGPGSVGSFVARFDPTDGGLLGAVGWRCGDSNNGGYPLPNSPLTFTDAGLVVGSSCVNPPTFRLFDLDGGSLELDGGYGLADGGSRVAGTELFVLRVSPDPALKFYGTPGFGSERFKGTVQLAGDDRPWFLSAVDAPHGGDLLPIDAVTDGGNAPHLARLSAYDFTPLHVDLFDCPGTHVSEWENLVWHGESGRVFAVLRTSANPMNGNCTAVVPGAFFGGGAGTIQPGLHRLLFGLENDGDSALGGLVTFLGDEPADAGALALVADGHDSLWGAGTVLGSLQGVTVPVPTLSVFNLDTQHFGVLFRNWRAEGAGHAELDDLAVLPSQQIWVLGTVSGSMVPEDGGTAVVTSVDSDTDGFLMRLNPSTLAPVAKVVFGNPHVSERMVKMVVRPPYAYVLATATPRPGAEGPYVFGGFDLGSLDSRDVLVFRIKLP